MKTKTEIPGADARTGMTVHQNLEMAKAAIRLDSLLSEDQKKTYLQALEAVPAALAQPKDAPASRKAGLVSRTELEELLGRKCSRQLLFQWVKRGIVDAVRIPGTRRTLGYSRESVMNLINGVKA